ncbi:hypothetical protein AGMMS49941_12110 [Deferribacterales bacterium]|nr:hypothetical protein AGMMS49941_12110 [Deferribacterales bacterium]
MMVDIFIGSVIPEEKIVPVGIATLPFTVTAVESNPAGRY